MKQNARANGPKILRGKGSALILPPLRSLRLRSAFDVRRFLGRLINEARRGQIELQDATRLAYLATVLMKSIELSDLEQRLSQLETGARWLSGKE